MKLGLQKMNRAPKEFELTLAIYSIDTGKMWYGEKQYSFLLSVGSEFSGIAFSPFWSWFGNIELQSI